MDISTVNQIIESITIFLTPVVTILLAYFLSKRLLKYKNNIDREIKLLKDLIFYRMVIDLYKQKVDEHEASNQYKNIRAEAKILTGIEPSRFSEPKQIEKRLKFLDAINQKVEKIVSKMDKKI